MLNIFEAASVSFFLQPSRTFAPLTVESEAAELFALCLRRAPLGQLRGEIAWFSRAPIIAVTRRIVFFFILNFFFLLKVYRLIQDENWQRSTSPQFFSGEARSARGVFGKHKAQFVRGWIDL